MGYTASRRFVSMGLAIKSKDRFKAQQTLHCEHHRFAKNSDLVGDFLVVCIILPFLVIKAVMHSKMLWRRDQVVNALQTAEAARLEEFDDTGRILSEHDLNSDQRVAVIGLFKEDVLGGVPFTLTMCWVPHHRMITRDAKGLEFVLAICFECDEAAITGTHPFSLPTNWRSVLRKLFEQNGFRLEPKNGS